MNKDIIVHLLQQDIKELSQLTDGFDELDEFPKPLLRLAKDKAENIARALKELENISLSQIGIIDNPLSDEDEVYFGGKNNFDIPLDSIQIEPIDTYEIEIQNRSVENYSETTDVESAKLDEVKDYTFDQDLTESNEGTENPTTEIKDDEKDDTNEIEILGNGDENNEEDGLIVGKTDKNNEDKIPKIVEKTTNTIFHDTLVDEDNSISSNLANKKIDDIRQAINIGDRFRFQRELFGGNGEVLNKTIAYLNQLAHFSEAEKFLNTKFNWAKDNVHAQEFLQIVKRRYL